eukprot:1180112-Prorocentrum_minimum.AAC.3
MAVYRQGIYIEYSVEYSKCRALNGILVSIVDDCRLLNSSRRPFWPSTPGLGEYLPPNPPTGARMAYPPGVIGVTTSLLK